MDFKQTEGEKQFVKELRATLDEPISLLYPEWKKANTTPREFFKIMGDAGLLGYRMEDGVVTQIPWQWNVHTYRELSQLSGGLSIAAFVQGQLGNKALASFVNDEQREKYLLPAIKGDKIMAIANTEPGTGSDAAGISLKAEDKGDHYLLNGRKVFITNGDIADAIVVTAVTDQNAEKSHRGISMFIVDGDLPGLTRIRMKKHGWIESHLSSLIFENVKVPKENLLGEHNRGFYQLMEVFNSSRIGLAALAFGTSLGAFKEAYNYSRKRKIFGKTIFEHDLKASEFAERITMLEAGWLMIKKAAFLSDSGEDFLHNASMAKLFTTEEGMKIAQWSALIFGARGAMDGQKVSAYIMDAHVALVGEGAPEVQKLIISRNIDRILDAL